MITREWWPLLSRQSPPNRQFFLSSYFLAPGYSAATDCNSTNGGWGGGGGGVGWWVFALQLVKEVALEYHSEMVSMSYDEC